MNITTRNLVGIGLLIVSIALLIPGLTYDLITLDISVNALISIEVYNETRSIIGTIEDLFANDNGWVGFLILFFSVIVPVVKAVLLLLIAIFQHIPKRKGIHKFIGLISKWSMADVFVVGVFIAFLSLKTNNNVNAEIHSGFWFFLFYCIVSIAASQVIQVKEKTI